MAHHQSALKRIRQSRRKRLQNRYYAKTTRNLIKKLRTTTEKAEAEKLLPMVLSNIDRMVKKNQFHRNKASNLKSKLMKHINSL